jgi:hypothetical protein
MLRKERLSEISLFQIAAVSLGVTKDVGYYENYLLGSRLFPVVFLKNREF